MEQPSGWSRINNTANDSGEEPSDDVNLYSYLKEFSPCGPDGCMSPPRYNQYDTLMQTTKNSINKPVFQPIEYTQTSHQSRYVISSEYYREAPLPPVPMDPRSLTPPTVTHIITSLHEATPTIPSKLKARPITMYQTITYSNYHLESQRKNIYPQNYSASNQTILNQPPMLTEVISPQISRPISMEFNQNFAQQQPKISYNSAGKFDDSASALSSTTTQSFEEGDIQNVLAKHGGNVLDFTEHEKPTLYDLLTPHVPDSDKTNIEFMPFQTLTGWMVGSPEKSLAYYALWKPAARGYQFALARMLSIPKIDLKLCSISPRLRRSIMLVSSMQYRCHYCAAHAAGVGDLLKGSWRAQVSAKTETSVISNASKSTPYFQNESRMDLIQPITDPMDRRISPKESDILRLVTAASRIPSKVTPELKKNVIRSIGVEGLQIVCHFLFVL
ncbi:hypothetical protein HK096_003894 [Nowakowskiella sp. JEL0078]|nr:hypothetical protein HK096_003894 [Nowakowskiella sp. JEL0078]